jgi:uncharacterized protein YndB with AHSA1/START domain
MQARPKLTIERTFDASMDDVWELCTTREGIESWWGPEGFSIAVKEMDMRPGGKLVYEMTATGPDQVEYMAQAGMPLTTVQRVMIEQVDPPRRLVYKDIADFIPGVEPYEVETVVELSQLEDGVRMVVTFDAMHDDQWTQMAKLGRESELEKLANLLAARE